MVDKVPLPEVAKPSITRLQAQAPIQDHRGLSTFLSGLIPQVKQGIEKDQRENQSRMIALGMNDQMNQHNRDVSWVDQHAYNQGKSLQEITSSQLHQEAQFTDYVNKALREPNADPDQVWEEAKGFLLHNVDQVYDSKLEPAYKEALYESNLKRNLAYQKIVKGTMQTVKQERFHIQKNNLTARLYNDWFGATANPSVEDQVTYLESYRADAYLNYLNNDIDPKEAGSLVNSDIKAVLQFARTQFNDPNQRSMERVAKYGTLVKTLLDSGYIDMPTAIEFDAHQQEVFSGVLRNNYQMELQAFNEFELKYQTDETLDYTQDITQRVAGLEADYTKGNLALEDKVKLTGMYLGYAAKRNNALLHATKEMTQGEFFGVPRTLAQWEADGKQATDFYRFYHQRALQRANNDPVTAGLLLMQDAMTGDGDANALPALARKGGEWVSNAIMGTLMTSREDLLKSDEGKLQLQRFESVKQAYQMLKQKNPMAANEFINGFPTEYQATLESAFVNGANITDVKAQLEQPANYQVTKESFDKALTGLSIDNFTGLFKGLSGQSATGSWFSWTDRQDNLDKQYLGLTQRVLRNNPSAFISRMGTSGNPETLARLVMSDVYVKAGAGYSDIIADPTAQSDIGRALGNGQASMVYVSQAIDARREELRKTYNVGKQNIHVTLAKNGSAHFHVFDKDGVTNFAGTPSDGIVMTQAQLLQGAKTQRTNAENKRTKELAASQKAGYMPTRGAPVGSAIVKVNGKATPVQWDNRMAKPFGGNVNFTQKWLTYTLGQEGMEFNAKASSAPSSGNQKSVLISGFGANLKAHPQWKAKFDSAKSAQDVMTVMSEFTAYHHAKMPELLAVAGLPPLTAQPYSGKHEAGAMLIADAYWMGGEGGGSAMARALKQFPTYKDWNKWFTTTGKQRGLYMTQKNGQVHRRTVAMLDFAQRHYAHN